MIQDTVDTLNEVFNSEVFDGGTFILHKELKVHPTFKTYKTLCYKLYLKTEHDLIPVLSQDETINTVYLSIGEVWKDTDHKFGKLIIRWLIDGGVTKLINQLSNGTEQVSNTSD